MAAPVRLGHIVLYKSSMGNSLHPAIVTEIPLLQANGADNFDADGNPYAVHLLVFGKPESLTHYHIPHKNSGHHEFFILPSEAPAPNVQDVAAALNV